MTDEKFGFSLNDEEKKYLKELVFASIRQNLYPEENVVLPEPPTDKLRENLGAFVTLKVGGRLRGCIGHVVGDRPLNETVARMAKSAAFQDPRFPPLSRGEFDNVDVEISILSPVVECPDPVKIEVGRHGLIIRKGSHQGLLLPQVAAEWGWDRETFLGHTAMKAGLPAEAWKDPEAKIFWFEAEVF
jgi:hypothetical protein